MKGGSMTDDQKLQAKKRIFDAAVRLFAKKGYAAVGIREIAKEANVQISMINYYFEGKIGVLKKIMDKYYIKYGEAFNDIGDAHTPMEKHVKKLINNLITFYRENADLANAAFGAIPLDVQEIIDYRIKWFESTRKVSNKWYEKFGFNIKDPIQMSVLRNFLDKIISGFFRARYCCDRVAQKPALSDHVKEHFKHDDHAVPLDNAFFEKYADYLAQVYLHGITSMIKKDQQKKGREK
jgi:AcrR family transcriptional regulator